MQGLNLKRVSRFVVIQSNELEGKELVEDEREFTVLQDALDAIEESQAPFRELKFNLEGKTYSLYPVPGSEEFRVTSEPICN